MRRVFVGVTGASGSIYAGYFLKHLSKMDDIEIHLTITDDGLKNIIYENNGITTINDFLKHYDVETEKVVLHDYKNMAAPVSSGSFKVSDYIVIPASMGCVGRIAGGISSNLVERCADVALKERRRLIVVFREAPLNSIHLENLLKLSRNGAITIPASPAFYHNPETIEDLILFIIGKIFDIMNIDTDLFKRWS
ncbi:UbiX family flavin prenyltransferase [Deferribacter autotrophicus]|uniref:Flavin prenyltransferase UbiX n=1 Tax=Deferribacter autotrophicus TaxID=500465 RepID=A0A5A8F435_9BACT|nr:UbiX family flavin prenyltransferase [Deferribacter autotrophicus]KAA0257803.1 UbiX family flavin prenyltransferase [Deferribacter autotrophicus]